MFNKLFLILTLLSTLIGCVISGEEKKGSSPKELKVISGNWGHLDNMSLSPDAPFYLINKRSDEIYKVCLAKYMAEEYPGIQEEIIASANIWAYYIGREINVEITIKDLPRATKNQTEEQLINAYYKICGNETEIVVGLGPIGKGNAGKVIPMYSYEANAWNKKRQLKVLDFKQALFLQDDAITPLDEKFISFQNFLKSDTAVSSDEILTILKSRSEVYYPKFDNNITLAVMLHEFGHVWGLCDQYEKSANCDPKFASLDNKNHVLLNTNSMMSSVKPEFNAYLTDDDIMGIRQLAQRKGFNADYNLSKQEIEFSVPEVKLKKNNILTSNSFSIVGGSKIMADLLFVISEDYELKAQVWSDSAGWIKYNFKDKEKIPYNNSKYQLSFDKPNNEKSKIQRVKITLKLLESNTEKVLNLEVADN